MPEYIAFYGSLMERAGDRTAPSRAGLSIFVQPCRLAGIIRDHGRYPGFFPSGDNDPPVVHAELHELVGPHAFTIFDRWEDYDPDDEAQSPYVRRRIMLIEPEIEAWIYISQVSDEDPIVQGGDWAAYFKAARTR